MAWPTVTASSGSGMWRQTRQGGCAICDSGAREVTSPETTRSLDIDQVIALILGDRKNFHAGEVCHLLRVRRPTLLDLRQQLRGELKSFGGTVFPIAGLRSFLKARWLGCEASKTPTAAGFARPGGRKSLLPPREARRIDFKKRSKP